MADFVLFVFSRCKVCNRALYLSHAELAELAEIMSSINERDYISLTDMVRNIENSLALIEKWLRNKNTIEFLGIWERLMNPNFNCAEFDTIKSQAGLNRFRLSAKEWTEKTNAIGIISKAGRYGGASLSTLRSALATLRSAKN